MPNWIYNSKQTILVKYEEFELTLDHPYVFEVAKNVKVGGNIIADKVPLVIGEIVNPNYSD